MKLLSRYLVFDTPQMNVFLCMFFQFNVFQKCFLIFMGSDLKIRLFYINPYTMFMFTFILISKVNRHPALHKVKPIYSGLQIQSFRH